MRESKRDLAIDLSLTSDDAIATNLLFLHAKVSASMRDQLIVLNKAALVKQKVNAFSSSQLVVRVLLIDPNLAASHEGLSLDFIQPLSESLF